MRLIKDGACASLTHPTLIVVSLDVNV